MGEKIKEEEEKKERKERKKKKKKKKEKVKRNENVEQDYFISVGPYLVRSNPIVNKYIFFPLSNVATRRRLSR